MPAIQTIYEVNVHFWSANVLFFLSFTSLILAHYFKWRTLFLKYKGCSKAGAFVLAEKLADTRDTLLHKKKKNNAGKRVTQDVYCTFRDTNESKHFTNLY